MINDDSWVLPLVLLDLELHLCTSDVPNGEPKYVICHCRYPNQDL
jgi:hypothetical protein